MKRTLLLSNFLLAVLIAASVWLLHRRNVEAQAAEAGFLNTRAQVTPALVFTAKPPAPIGAQAYVDNAVQKFVFSRDRNPNVIEKPNAPPPELPMPPLPALYGVFTMGDRPTIFLGIGNAPQRGYQTGAQVGDFTLVAFDDKTVIHLEPEGSEADLRGIGAESDFCAPAAGCASVGSGAAGREPRNERAARCGHATLRARRRLACGNGLCRWL